MEMMDYRSAQKLTLMLTAYREVAAKKDPGLTHEYLLELAARAIAAMLERLDRDEFKDRLSAVAEGGDPLYKRLADRSAYCLFEEAEGADPVKVFFEDAERTKRVT